jgi:hypothetical protein
MTMKVKVNIMFDFSMGACTHLLWVPPAPPVPAPSIEVPCPQFWPPGYIIPFVPEFTNKGPKKFVQHKNQWITLDDHDCGPLIPDVTVPPFPNAYYPFQWPVSSRQMVFSASSVKMSGLKVACAQLFGPTLPMMTCGKPCPLPTALSMITFTNTVSVGFTSADYLKGLLGIGIKMAFGAIFSTAFPAKAITKPLEALAKGLAGRAIPVLIGEGKKAVLNDLSGFSTNDLKGNPTFAASGGDGAAPPAPAPATAPNDFSGLLGPPSVTGTDWMLGDGSAPPWGAPEGGTKP